MSEASVGRIDLDLGVNYSQFNKELNSISNTAGRSATRVFSKLGSTIALAFSTTALVAFSKSAIGLASDLQEVQNVVSVTFGSASSDIEQFAKDAIYNFGMGELSTKKFASSFGASLKSLGFGQKQFTEMSKTLTELTGDMASFYNLKHEEAWNKIRAGVISGEAEPLKVLGVNLNAASLEAFALASGIKKSYNEMGEAEKALLRYNFVLNATKDAQGDFARTSNSWANQVRVLSEQFNSFRATIGAGLINALTPVLTVINQLIAKLQVAAAYFRAFTAAVFGEQANMGASGAAVETVSSGLDGVANSAKKAGKEAKKAASNLAGFDEINVIGEQAGGGAAAEEPATAGGGAVIPDLFPAVDEQKTKIDDIQTAMDGLVANIRNTVSEISKAMSTNFAPAIESTKAILSGLQDSAFRVFDGIMVAGAPLFDWLVSNLPSAFSTMVNVSAGILESLFNITKNIFDTVWEQAIQPGLALASQMITNVLDILRGAWAEHGQGIYDDLLLYFGMINTLWSTWWDTFLGPIVTTLLEQITFVWDKHFKGLVKNVTDLLATCVKSFLEIMNKVILPFVKFLIEKFGPPVASVFKLVISIVASLLATTIDVMSGTMKALNGIVTFLTGVFTGNWKKAWEGIVKIFSGIFTGITGIVRGVFNIVIDLINAIIREINKIKVDIPDWIPGVGGNTYGISIPTIPKLAKGGLATAPTLAMVGDNRGANVDPEVISPLSKLQDMIGANNGPMLEVLLMILEAIRESGNKQVVLDGETISRLLKPYMDKENKRQGTEFIVV